MTFRASSSQKLRCAACRDDLGEEGLASCSDCSLQIHDLCRELVRACPTLGCSGAIIGDSKTEQRASSKVDRAFLFVGLVILAVLFLISLTFAAMTLSQALVFAGRFQPATFLALAASLLGVIGALRAASSEPPRPATGPRAFVDFLRRSLERGAAATVNFGVQSSQRAWRGLRSDPMTSLFAFAGGLFFALPASVFAFFVVCSQGFFEVIGAVALLTIVALVVALAAWINRDR